MDRAPVSEQSLPIEWTESQEYYDETWRAVKPFIVALRVFFALATVWIATGAFRETFIDPQEGVWAVWLGVALGISCQFLPWKQALKLTPRRFAATDAGLVLLGHRKPVTLDWDMIQSMSVDPDRQGAPRDITVYLRPDLRGHQWRLAQKIGPVRSRGKDRFLQVCLPDDGRDAVQNALGLDVSVNDDPST